VKTDAPPKRPTVKHALTATAFGLVTIRNAWRAYFRAVAEERRRRAAATRSGWGG
jgi:hypothetical protein